MTSLGKAGSVMCSRISGGWAAWMGLAVALSGFGCSSAFQEDCKASRSCAQEEDSANAGAAGESHGDEAGGSAGSDGAGGDDGGREASGSCTRAADCDDGDPSNGVESCQTGVCQPGNAPPQVVAVSPADGAADAEPDAVITLTFSEPLDPKTATEETLQLLDGDTEVPGTFALSRTGREITFTPGQRLTLWTNYRIELSDALRDHEGAAMLAPFEAEFRVRDGAWSVQTLARGTSVTLPRSLPVRPDGTLLATWLHEENETCAAAGSWVRGDEAEPAWLFKTVARDGDCRDLSASVASDGNAAVSWLVGEQDYSLAFMKGAWAPAERMNAERGKRTPRWVTTFAHAGAKLTTFAGTTNAGHSITVDVGSMSGTWEPTNTTFIIIGPPAASPGAFASNGSGFGVAMGLTGELLTLRYDAEAGAWESAPVGVPGSESGGAQGIPAIASTPEGDALVVVGDRTAAEKGLRSSRYRLGEGWQSELTVVTEEAGMKKVRDAPGLVFDGRTFVTAWTGVNEGRYVPYTARYDLDDDSWEVEAPHLTEFGESALVVPRLGADARGNLLLVWAIAGTETKVAYQRYHSESGVWGEIQHVSGVSLLSASEDPLRALQLALAPNGTGGLLFKTRDADGEAVKLAQFY